jgi:pantoate--beta-alanine ligase
VTATIFVNPLQFGPGEDLAVYPRDLEADARAAAGVGVDHLFAPPVGEMFPTPPLTSVHVAQVSEGREGASRPGHFAGVATVVAKLLAIAGPCRVYFGEKDHQQLQVVRRMVSDLSMPVEVVACPTVRDVDGLALSSRNAGLSIEERAAASVLYRALLAGREMARSGGVDSSAVRRTMIDVVEAEFRARVDYADVVEESDGSIRLFVAAWIGTTRLIDNLEVSAP